MDVFDESKDMAEGVEAPLVYLLRNGNLILEEDAEAKLACEPLPLLRVGKISSMGGRT